MGFITLTEAHTFVRAHLNPVALKAEDAPPENVIEFHRACEDRPGPCSHFTRDTQGRLREVRDSG